MDDFLNPLRGYIEVEVRDREGRIVGRGRHEMRSFLNNLLRILGGMMDAAGGFPATSPGAGVVVRTSTTVITLAGSSATAYTEAQMGSGGNYGGGVVFAVKAADNDDTYGIIVGSGTVGVALDQYAPASKIAHGTGSGQLVYGLSSYEDLGLDTGVSPPVYRFRVMRTFSNLSGAAININEVCIVARSYWKEDSGVRNDVKYMIARDALPSTYTVPNGGTATVAVTVEVVVG
jgi:hypothetical protein